MTDPGPLAATALLVTTAAAAVCTVLDRVWRHGDPVFRHTIWAALMAASLAGPALAALLPGVVQVPIMPVTDLDAAARSSWLSAVTGVYLAVGAGLVIRLLLGVFLIKRLILSARPATPGDHARLVRLCGPAVAIRCRVHPRLQSPVTAAWQESFVLLPASAFDWTDARLRAVVEHEWAHVCRSDFWWNLAAGLYRAVYWPSPLAWLVVRRLQLTAELACDRRASRVIGSTAFARVLVESARDLLPAGGRVNRLAPGAGTNLAVRIDALLSDAVSRQSRSTLARRVAAGVVLAVVMSAMLVRFAPGPVAASAIDSAVTPAPVLDGNHEAIHAVRHRH
jgi:beta-lactamase regulating signal transducer with metallopeptidase domain